jgi:cytidylate kinase
MKDYNNPNLAKIAHRHLQIWGLRQDVHRRRSLEPSGDEECIGPVVTISRIPYSGGHEVARLCAEKLDWQLFDKDIVDHIARNSDTATQFVDSLDERCRQSMNDWIQTAIDVKSMGHMAYLRHLKQVMMIIASHGNAVILGRGGNFILPPEAGLRILVTSPPKHRLGNLMEGEKLTHGKAVTRLKQLDGRRNKFLKTHFLRAGQELDHYDLILNMEHLDPETASTIIVDSFYTHDR